MGALDLMWSVFKEEPIPEIPFDEGAQWSLEDRLKHYKWVDRLRRRGQILPRFRNDPELDAVVEESMREQ